MEAGPSALGLKGGRATRRESLDRGGAGRGGRRGGGDGTRYHRQVQSHGFPPAILQRYAVGTKQAHGSPRPILGVSAILL